MFRVEEVCTVKQFNEKLHIDVPPETAFDVVVDPDAQQSRFMKVEVVNETPDSLGTTLRYHYKVAGMRLGGGTYTYSEYVPGERFTWEFSGGPEMFVMGGPVSSTWTFEAADGGTDLTIDSEFKTRIPVLNNLTRRIFMRSWRKRDLPRFKAEIEKRAKAKVEA